MIYDPVKRKTGGGLEGCIYGLGVAPIFQVIPGGLVKHRITPLAAPVAGVFN